MWLVFFTSYYLPTNGGERQLSRSLKIFCGFGNMLIV